MLRTVFPSNINSPRLYIQRQVCVIQVRWLLASGPASKQSTNLCDIYLTLYVQSWTPDNWWKDRPKHVEWYSVNSKNCASSWFCYRKIHWVGFHKEYYPSVWREVNIVSAKFCNYHGLRSDKLLHMRPDSNQNNMESCSSKPMETVLECCHFVAMSDENGSLHVLTIIVLSSVGSVVIVGKIESIWPPCPTLSQLSTVPPLDNELLFQL